MKKAIQFRGVKFLIFTLIVLLFLSLFDGKGVTSSLLHSLNILSQIWPVFLFIIVLTTIVNYFLKPKSIMKHIGEESGNKGRFYALIAGVISHGPMYAWYGLLDDLRQNGAKDELLIIFLYARAIKIPMIPFSIAVFGTPFTVIICIYILIFALLQGKVFTILWNKN
jgi:uncharacterized membrane protein YraQ (UPF0718 family)